MALAVGGVLAALLIVVGAFASGGAGLVAMGLAALAFFAGTLVERWLFFAEARHAVMAYYGR